MFLTSCTDSSDNCDINSLNTNTSNYGAYAESYESYQITSSNSEFNESIKNNIIDVNYNKSISTANSTREFIDIENRYINIWEDEMNSSIEMLVPYLSETDKNKFFTVQEKWYETSIDDLSVSVGIISNPDYNINLGSSSQYLFLSNKRKLFRNRTISIKYLTYLIETQTDNPIKNQKWSDFHFKE